MANLYIFSLGQMLQTNNIDAVNAFSNYVRVADGSYYRKFTDFLFGQYKQDSYLVSKIDQYGSLAFINIAYLLDFIYYGTIASYKKGLLSTDEFKSKIASQLFVPSGKPIEDAWKSMCVISDDSIKTFEKFVKSEHKFIITSVTNEMQFDYIMQQLNQKIDLQNNSNVYFVTSFDNHLLSHKELAKIGIESGDFDRDDNFILSYHQGIKDLDLSSAQVSYKTFTNFDDIENF